MPLTRQQKKDLNIIDLESFAMTSKDLIDAKLEVFEMRMEDKLRALFVEFKLEKRLNQYARRTKVITRPSAHRLSAPPTTSRPSQSKKLTREELCDSSAKELCWHYDEPWSRDRHCKKGRLLMIEPIEESEHEDTDLESEKDTEEDPQSIINTIHTLVGYVNPQMMKIRGFLKHQPAIVLIDIGNTNNFMNNKVTTRLMLQIEDYSRFDVKVADGRILKYNRSARR
ncbi:hypothetical protein BHE74_00007829 [Ensete ventricosum]|nr:hypothetical protein BHE74_00007829 [Ensete ventricosum]